MPPPRTTTTTSRKPAIDSSSSGTSPTRLQKTVAAALGISRRKADALVVAGRVAINGVAATPGSTHLPDATITVDGAPLALPAAATGRIIAYYKPRGQITSRQGADQVFASLPAAPAGRNWLAVGRLDVASEGLLLFTDCGQIVNRLAHPSAALEREYEVHSPDRIAAERLAAVCKSGLIIDGRRCRPRLFCILPGGQIRYRVVVCEGRNRLVRKMFACLQARVSRLIRVRFGNLRLPRTLTSGSTVAVDLARITGKNRGKKPQKC